MTGDLSPVILSPAYINTIYVQGTKLLSTDLLQVVTCRHKLRAANYCRTSDNVPLNLANVRAKVILSHYTFFCCDKIRCKFTQFAFCNKITRHSSILLNVAPEWLHTCLVTYIYLVTYTVYVRPNLVVLVFVRPNSSYARPKLKVIGQMSCQVKYLFAALQTNRSTHNQNTYRSSLINACRDIQNSVNLDIIRIEWFIVDLTGN